MSGAVLDGKRVYPWKLSGTSLSRWKRVCLFAVLGGISLYFVLWAVAHTSKSVADIPLWIGIVIGGAPFLVAIIRKLLHREFGADILAGISVVTAVLMSQVLVAAIIVLMLSGGEVLEDMATRRASRVLSALAKRSPTVAHRVREAGLQSVAISDISIGDTLVVLPHEICPVDGSVLEGESRMDESFLTGEPYLIRKTVGSPVISGSLNGETSLKVIAEKLPEDSRYARIMQVVEAAEKTPPPMRRLGDQLGALYTPIALLIATGSWIGSGDPKRFLAVLVIATPCPLLLAIPTAIIGAVSLAAKHSIIIRKPAVLEQVSRVRTMLFDKTGTLTNGRPQVTDIVSFGTMSSAEILSLAASLEQYSKHPLSSAILAAAAKQRIKPWQADIVHEKPGQGLKGLVAGRKVAITGRKKLAPEIAASLPVTTSGMECIVIVEDRPEGLIRFHDQPRSEGRSFMDHLRPKHNIQRLLILSGDRDSEVQHLASIVGVQDVRSGLSPEEKLRIVSEETKRAPTLFLGDGVNDAPAMLAATIGVAFGQSSDVTAEAAGAVILDASLERVDELLHIGRRMRLIALESAVGGICLSVLGMTVAAFGLLPPIRGALGQEAIDLLAVLNAVRVSIPTSDLRDFPRDSGR